MRITFGQRKPPGLDRSKGVVRIGVPESSGFDIEGFASESNMDVVGAVRRRSWWVFGEWRVTYHLQCRSALKWRT